MQISSKYLRTKKTNKQKRNFLKNIDFKFLNFELLFETSK